MDPGKDSNCRSLEKPTARISNEDFTYIVRTVQDKQTKTDKSNSIPGTGKQTEILK